MKVPFKGFYVGSTIDKNAADLDADFLISAHFDSNPLIALWTKEDDMFFRHDLYKLRDDILGKRDARSRVNWNMSVDEDGNVLKHDDEDYLFEDGENASTIAEDYHPSKEVISDYSGYSEYHFELDYDEDPIIIFEYTGEHHVNIDNPLKFNLENNYVFHRYDYFFYFATLFFIFYNDFFITGYLYIIFGHVMAIYLFEVENEEEEIELEDEIALEEYTVKAFYLIDSYNRIQVESYYPSKWARRYYMNSLVFNYQNAFDYKKIHHVAEYLFTDSEDDFIVKSNKNFGHFVYTQNYSLNYLGLWQDYSNSINDNIDFNYLIDLQINYKIMMNEKENFDLFLGYKGNKDFTILTYHKSHLDFSLKTYDLLYKEIILTINNEFIIPEPTIKYRYFIV